MHWHWFEYLTYITCIVYDLGALGLHRGYKTLVPCKMISCSQSVHGFGQFNKDCSALPHNWKDDLSWPSG